MDIARLFRSSRLGDIESIKFLIEERDIDINIKDKWNSSPLYYACLCGHIDLVRYLLANGAICDAKTFDGERCVYGALTKEIRKVLVNDYKVISKQLIRRNDYDEFLRKAFEVGHLYDVIFKVHNAIFKVHKCILATRCDYFRRMFNTKWKEKNVIHINHKQVSFESFKILLHYLYTGNLEFKLSIKDQILRLFRQCNLYDILQIIQDQLKNTKIEKSKSKILNFRIEIPMKQDYYKLYLSCRQNSNQTPVDDFDDQIYGDNYYADVVFQSNNQYFQCHKVFFCGRSDFFSALINDYFFESKEIICDIPVYKLTNISVDAFDALLCFVYTNSTAVLSIDVAFELLLRSDLYLFNSLKKHCANIVGEHVSQLNPIDLIKLIKLSRTLNLSKLESTAIEYISNNLEQFINCQDFKELIVLDAKEIKERQESDTIGIIDDIRFYLSNSYIKDIDNHLSMVDSLLESLDLVTYRDLAQY